MRTARSRRVALLACSAVAGLCIVGVLVSVVRTARDGSVDWLALVAVGALVVAWRLYRQVQTEALHD